MLKYIFQKDVIVIDNFIMPYPGYILLKILIFIYIALGISAVSAQVNQDSAYSIVAGSNPVDTSAPVCIVKGYAGDMAAIWTSPFRLKRKDVFLILPAVSAMIISFGMDKEIRNTFFNISEKSSCFKRTGNFMSEYGSPYYIGALSGLTYLGGLASKNSHLSKTGFLCIESCFQTIAVVYTLKIITGRQRPSYDNGMNVWHWFPASSSFFKGEPFSKYGSFPSSHAAVAFGVATIIAERETHPKIIPVSAYALATGIALSRISEDKHWFSDVLAGSFIGYGIGKMIAKRRENTRWTLFPSTFRNNVVICATANF